MADYSKDNDTNKPVAAASTKKTAKGLFELRKQASQYHPTPVALLPPGQFFQKDGSIAAKNIVEYGHADSTETANSLGGFVGGVVGALLGAAEATSADEKPASTEDEEDDPLKPTKTPKVEVKFNNPDLATYAKSTEGDFKKKPKESYDKKDHNAVEEFNAESAARLTRIETFTREAQKQDIPGLVTSNQHVTKYVGENEEVVQVIKAVEISGMPATTDFVTVAGAIEVALVRVKGDPSTARILFSVASGVASLNISEKFQHSGCVARGLCSVCFPQSCLACICPCFNQGSFLYDYHIGEEVTNQFSYLPVLHSFIDAMTYHQAAQEYTATAADSIAGDCSCCVISCCNCSCCGCPTCLDFDHKTSTREFTAQESQVVGKELTGPGSLKKKTETVDGVEWHVGKVGINEVYVVITYRSYFDHNLVRQCKIKLAHEGDPYDEARRFVTALGINRGPLFEHPALRVSPVGAFGRGVRIDGSLGAVTGLGNALDSLFGLASSFNRCSCCELKACGSTVYGVRYLCCLCCI